MNPVDITERTRAIGAPLNWGQSLDGPCGILCVRDGVDLQSGARTMASLWKPSGEDLRLLNLGLPILLTIFGVEHPVVSMSMAQPSDIPTPKE